MAEKKRPIKSGKSTGKRTTAKTSIKATTSDIAMSPKDKAASKQASISLCVIVKNEEKYLPVFLSAMVPLVDEIVIVDTGSKDDSLDIIRRFNIEPIQIEWPKSFSKARNVSLDNATKDIILVMDPDEKMEPAEMKKLREAISSSTAPAFNVTLKSQVERSIKLRAFRNKKANRFVNAVYEEIDLGKKDKALVQMSGATIEHFGYDHEIKRSEKGKRNLVLLNEDYGQNGPSPSIFYHIATEYFYTGKLTKASEFFLKAMEQESSIRPMAVRGLIMSLEKEEKFAEIRTVLDTEIKKYPDYIDLLYISGLIYELQGEYHSAIKEFEKSVKIKKFDPKYDSFQELLLPKALNGLGFCYLQLGDLKKSEEFFKKTLKIEKLNGAALLYLKESIWKIDDPVKFDNKLHKFLAK